RRRFMGGGVRERFAIIGCRIAHIAVRIVVVPVRNRHVSLLKSWLCVDSGRIAAKRRNPNCRLGHKGCPPADSLSVAKVVSVPGSGSRFALEPILHSVTLCPSMGVGAGDPAETCKALGSVRWGQRESVLGPIFGVRGEPEIDRRP